MRALHTATLIGLIASTVLTTPTASPQGFTPTYPAPLNTTAASDSAGDSAVDLATDGQGNWVGVWASGNSLGGTIGTDGDILVARSTDNGATWTPPSALNTFAAMDSGSDRDPKIATDGLGNWVVAWRSEYNLGGTIGTDLDILVARSTNNGATWTSAALVNSYASTDSFGESQLLITTDRIGTWVATWTGVLPGALGLSRVISRSFDNGASWSSAASISSGATLQDRMATDGLGNWIHVRDWPGVSAGSGADSEISTFRSSDNAATWSTPTLLNTTAITDSDHDLYPDIATDSIGNWIAVWVTGDLNGGAFGDDGDIVFARSTNNGLSWSAPTPLNNDANSDTRFDFDPRIATDGQGNWIVAWNGDEDPDNENAGTDKDIYVARSTNNGISWTTPTALNTNAAVDDGGDAVNQSLEIATDGLGNWLSAWTSWSTLGGTIGFDADILQTRWTLLGFPTLTITFVQPARTVNGEGTQIAPFNNLTDAGQLAAPNATIYSPRQFQRNPHRPKRPRPQQQTHDPKKTRHQPHPSPNRRPLTLCTLRTLPPRPPRLSALDLQLICDHL